jgi:hypothetical protein
MAYENIDERFTSWGGLHPSCSCSWLARIMAAQHAHMFASHMPPKLPELTLDGAEATDEGTS